MKTLLTFLSTLLFTTVAISLTWPVLFLASAIIHMGWQWGVMR